MRWGCCQISDFTEAELEKLYGQLSPSRKARIDRLRREEDRKRSLAGEMLVYDLLKQENITGVSLHCHENGQPYLTGCKLQVSISHCDQMVACAISEDPVGIDIERMRPIKLKLCRHVCVPEEMEYLALPTQDLEKKCDDEAVLRRFFEIWTAKEAYFKKCGTGITDLKGINILPLQRQVYVKDDYLIQIL